MNSTASLGKGRPRTRLLVAFLLLAGVLFGIGVATQTSAQASTVTITTFAGNGTAGTTGDGGPATSAELWGPQGLSTDNAGNVYIAESRSGIADIRKVDASGTISTMVNANHGFCNSSSFTSSLTYESGLAFSTWLSQPFDGSAYINNCHWLDEVWPDGTQAHAAGLGAWGSNPPLDGPAYSVKVNPSSFATGGAGGAYFIEPDAPNSIKTLNGSVNTLAGPTGSNICYTTASDGDPISTTCLHPSWLIYHNNSLYFFDAVSGGRGPEIFRIDLTQSSPTLQLIAGNGSWNDSGTDDSTATSDGISNVGPMAMDSAGNLYFGSVTTGALREVDTSGKMWNVANFGGVTEGFAFDSANNLYATTGQKVVKVSGLDTVASKGSLVALGDSVVAGEGLNYDFAWNGSGWVKGGPSSPSWTDTTSSLGGNFQQCHQSDYANSRYFSGAYTVYNMACTGASALSEPGLNSNYTAAGVLRYEDFGGGSTVPAQLGSGSSPRCSGCDAANPLFDTNLGMSGTVLLQVGADDIDFGSWVKQCYSTGCGTSGDTSTRNSQLSQAATDLRTTLTELSSRASQDGYGSSKKLRVVVTDYYNPYGDTYNNHCVDSGNSIFPSITAPTQAWIVSGLDALDTNIQSEVQYAQSNDSNLNVSLVDLAGLFTASQTGGLTDGQDIMSGHTFCTTDPWVYGPSIDYPHWGNPALPNYPAPMHPTLEGQIAIYNAIKQQSGM